MIFAMPVIANKRGFIYQSASVRMSIPEVESDVIPTIWISPIIEAIGAMIGFSTLSGISDCTVPNRSLTICLAR